MPEYFRVISPFYAAGVLAPFTVGQIVSGDDAIYKGREEHFESVATAATRAIGVTETASAGPGELRFRGRPKTKTAEEGPNA